MIKTIGLKKALCKVSAFLLVLLMLTSVFGVSASAEAIEKPAYDTYTYWSGANGRDSFPVSATPMYELDRVITGADLGISAFNDPRDVFVDVKGLIYLMDSGNGRLVVVNPDFTLNKVIKDLKFKEEAVDFTGAGGVFVTPKQEIYIADTENERVIVTNLEGVVSKILVLPSADIIPDDFTYRPSKIAIDSEGYTYVLSEGSYYGSLMYKPTGEFMGFFGSNSVQSSILGAFQRLYEIIFVSESKLDTREKKLPYSFSDIVVDGEDFVYTATGATSTTTTTTGQLKKMAPKGTNVLSNKTGQNAVGAESTDFSDTISATTLALPNGTYIARVTDIYSMDVDAEGYMYGLCRNFGHIFIYDQECNPLTVFGGGFTAGDQDGTFARASSIQYNEKTNDIYVVDATNINLTVFKETEFGRMVKEAQKLTIDGSYVDAKPLWEKVLTKDRNCQLAYRGLAKAALLEKDYDKCIEYAKLGVDQATYSSAFKFVRNDWISANFVWIFLIIIAAVGGLIFFMVYSNKHEVKLIKNPQVATMFNSIMHPFEGSQQVRYYNKGSMTLATICMVLFFITTVISDMTYGFMYREFDKSSYSVFFPLLKNFGLVLLWTVANWGMSTLFEGKGTMKHVYIVTCYALIPIIANNLIQAALSNVVTPEEALVMNAINVVLMAVAIIMLVVGIMTVHEYGFFKFLVMAIVVILAMLVVVFVVLMIFVLIQQATSFIGSLYNELIYR